MEMYSDKVKHHNYLKVKTDVPWNHGMTSLNEQKYLRWFSQEVFKDNGAIVELGCWLGSLTKSICDGLSCQNLTNHKVHVYDLFEWEHNMEDTCESLELNYRGKYKDGEDYSTLYKQVMNRYVKMLQINKLDLVRANWDKGPIELLVVDAMKYESLCDNITRQFYPALIPGSSYIVHQDFMHFYESWGHISAYRLREYIRPVYEVLDSGSMVFKCLNSPPIHLLGFDAKIENITDSEIDEAYTWALAITDRRTRNIIGAAHTMAYIHKGNFLRALELYKYYRKEYPPSSSLTPKYYQLDHLRDYILRFNIVSKWP